MLRFRNSELGIALRPGQLEILHRSGWPRPRVVDAQSIPVDGVGWSQAVKILDAWLEAVPQSIRRASVVVSNRYVRHAWLPWNGSLNKVEREVLAHARFRELYGDMPGWTVRADRGTFGKPNLASAVEQEMIDALRRCFERRKIACRALVPFFSAAWNIQRNTIGNADAIFAVIEPGTAVVATLTGTGKDRYWRSLRTVRGEFSGDSLTRLLDLEILLQEMPGDTERHIVTLLGSPSVAKGSSGEPLTGGVIELSMAEYGVGR